MSKSQDPRIAPKEMIVTRFKSAQQRRQLREKDRSMTKVTQLLKSPPQKKGRKKGQKSPKKETAEVKSPVVSERSFVDEVESKEYYPDKLKRVPGHRKQFLKPKPHLRTVASTNKRKFNTPRKGIKYMDGTHIEISPWPEEFQPSAARDRSESPCELSMGEVVRMVEDTESLDDEDLMEILTCPSPVWWEEPRNHTYMQDAICTWDPEEKTLSPIKEKCYQTYTEQTHKKNRRKNAKNKREDSDTHENSNEGNRVADQMDISDIANDRFKVTEKKDERFIKKRKKLENVLGNIKSKAGKKPKRTDEDRSSLFSNSFEPHDNNNECVPQINDKLGNYHDKDTIDESNDEKHAVVIKEETNSSKIKRISESTEEDIADLTADDDMLLNLENIQIPIESNSVDRAPSSASVIFINDDPGAKITLIEDVPNALEVNNANNNRIEVDSCNLNGDVVVYKNNGLAIKQEIIFSNSDIGKESDKTDITKAGPSNTMNIKTEEPNINNDKAEIKLLEVPKNLPPLKKRPKIETPTFPSPVSFKSTTDDTTECSSLSSHVSDTISDTNIKFIMDDDIEDISDVEIKNETATKKFANEDVKKEDFAIYDNASENKETDTKKEFITVYKIVPSDSDAPKINTTNKFKSIPEYSNHVEALNSKTDLKIDTDECSVAEMKGQLNSFFKKCKNVNRKRCKKFEDTAELKTSVDSKLCDSCEPKKSITVAQDENVKYCLKCSSIFDTEECSYCLKSINSAIAVNEFNDNINSSLVENLEDA